ncbi:MAG: helix-turn-helix transcriptional regulator [Myxococcales bacterium]
MDAPPKNDERDADKEAKAGASANKSAAHPKKVKNNVRKIRMERMMSKAELARRAGLSTLTVDRVERGMPCRMDTKRKILEAMGLAPSDRVMVFGDSEED